MTLNSFHKCWMQTTHYVGETVSVDTSCTFCWWNHFSWHQLYILLGKPFQLTPVVHFVGATVSVDTSCKFFGETSSVYTSCTFCWWNRFSWHQLYILSGKPFQLTPVVHFVGATVSVDTSCKFFGETSSVYTSCTFCWCNRFSWHQL